jgi:hypothetical protein
MKSISLYKYTIVHIAMALLCLFALNDCISVKIPTSSGSRAKDVKLQEPAKPFQSINNAAADQAWISNVTGNTISYVSDCNGTSDPSLQQLENESLGVLNKLNVVETKSFEFNGRDARETVAEGEVDGVPVKTALVVFKKNGCNFTLSYGGIRKTFAAEKNYFETFTQNFHAQ